MAPREQERGDGEGRGQGQQAESRGALEKSEIPRLTLWEDGKGDRSLTIRPGMGRKDMLESKRQHSQSEQM